MTGRSRGSDKQAKARRRKAKTPKHDSALSLGRRSSSGVGQESEFARLHRERDEALERETATAEVLKVISSSPGELEPVFQAMLANAVRICEAKAGNIYRWKDGTLRLITTRNTPPGFADFLRRTPLHATANNPVGRMQKTKSLVHTADLAAQQPYIERSDPAIVAAVDLGGCRTQVSVPLLKKNDFIGAITLWRDEVRPFDDKQIALVQNFAAQAVIAIENARLLNELRQRTDDLQEALEQQTATTEVLKVISNSPADLQPVFQAMLENGVRACGAKFGVLFRFESGMFHPTAMLDVPPAFAEVLMRQGAFPPQPGQLFGRLCESKSVIQIEDRATESHDSPSARYGGARSAIAVPMLKADELVGAFFIYRTEVQPFTNKQIELVQNFAAQAVIAIENTRLLNELRQSLEQQTATSEVLGVISSSPGELQPVFDAMLANATRICEASFGNLLLYNSDVFRHVALHNAPQAWAVEQERDPVAPRSLARILYRVTDTKQVVHVADIVVENPEEPIAKIAGARTLLIAPMLKENDLVGVIAIYRQEVRPFTDKQIELVQNFAAQAVIAIENARLLNELRESLEQQTATSEVLKVISSSPADIQPVLEIIGERAKKLCDAEISVVSIVESESIHPAAFHGLTEAARRSFPQGMRTDETVTARAIRTRSVCHVADVLDDPRYELKEIARVSGYRGCLAVPMVRDEQVVGAIFVARKQPGLFSDAQVQLLKTFADQAVIAIGNVRLFNETKNSLEQQTATADVLKIISRSTFDLRGVLQTLVESAARFCAADKASVIREKAGVFYSAEAYGYSHEFMDYIKNIPVKPERGSASGRALAEGRVVHIADVKADREYALVEAPRLGDFRTILCVPMLREGVPIGILTLTRSQVQPFTDKQIELVTTFADQASIAIENVRLLDEIQDKSRQLEEASQHKSQFLANMSHELRTPLNAILGYTELMADGAYGEPSEKMSGILKRLEANGKHLLGLINDVLDLSKIEAGQLVLELVDYTIQDIAQTVRSTLEPLAADKKLAFKLDVSPELPPGHGDGRRLTQVLINLVGNAIKFTDAGEVAIKAEANNGSFYVSVRDTGPGISAADQAKLFQEFQQADNAITKKKGGTGLGLAISKRIIEMHGGKIWVESQPGQGSTFAFSLPVIVERQVEAA